MRCLNLKRHTLKGARNFSDNSDSANALPVRAIASAFTPIRSRSSRRPVQILNKKSILPER